METIRFLREARILCGDNLVIHVAEQLDGVWNVDFKERPYSNQGVNAPQVRVPIKTTGCTHWVFWKDIIKKVSPDSVTEGGN